MRTQKWIKCGFIVISTISLILLTPVPAGAQAPPQIGGCQLFPSDNIWNTPITDLPVDPNSAAYINTIGANTNLHPDFGSGDWPPGSGNLIGIPYNIVPSGHPKVSVSFDYASESDFGPYPIPTNPLIEGGSDRHILIVEQGTPCKLYELFDASKIGSNWYAGSGAIFDLSSNALRPDGWTSADAAGLPILPGLVRYEEVVAGEINHALRFTAAQTYDGYVWPARHEASDLQGSQYPPMGQRFRLKAGVDISGFSPEIQVILTAMKTYGLILADNGSNWYISGAPNENWDNDMLRKLRDLQGSDFEAVDVSSLMIDEDSGQAKTQGFTLSAQPGSQAIQPGAVATYTLQTTGPFTDSVTLIAASPSPSLTLGLSSSTLPVPGQVILTLTDTHPGPTLLPGLFYRLPVTGTGGNFTQTITVNLLVGGTQVYLPLILK